ncbi:MAG: hypothetical protein Q7S93_10160 [Phenylobacterium sp.]|uniref:hypothetical protein n=1 Tax=Phenylobacterium sp. TaxID=1871053 RepID=UPI00271BBD1E|nr:hypothetical protein [Phenylobacterium sp.]MDO8410410.1 hypothetical protein [Phenylobacterium sp.]
MNRPLAPALLLALLVGAHAAPAAAQGLPQDRYGPPQPWTDSPQAASARSADVAYAGPMLGWAGKRSPQGPPANDAATAPERPEPMALSRQFAYAQPPAQAPRAAPPPPVQPGYEPVLRGALAPVSDRAPDLLGGPPAGPLPTSIYDQAAAAPAAPQPQYQQQAPAPAEAPRQFAQSAPLPAARPGGSQLYSLHREYGMTPDAIPAPPQGQNYILVGPPDAPPAEEEADEGGEGLDRQF